MLTVIEDKIVHENIYVYSIKDIDAKKNEIHARNLSNKATYGSAGC